MTVSTIAIGRPRRSRGALILTRMGLQSELAKMLGCTTALVGFWTSGARVPSADWRVRLHELFGILPGEWDLAPQSRLTVTPTIGERMARELEAWPVAQKRALALLERVGIR